MKSFPRMLSQRLNHFLAQGAIKSFPHMFSIAVHAKTVNIFSLAEHTRKFVRLMLSVR
jgi:hypothetical protein